MTPPEFGHLNKVAARALELRDTLLARAKPRGRWRAGAWHTIADAIKDEAQFAEECEPESVCAFVFLVEVAGMHLEDNRSEAHANELRVLLQTHVLRFADKAPTVSDLAYSDTQKEAMFLSLIGLNIIVGNLKTLYPDAP